MATRDGRAARSEGRSDAELLAGADPDSFAEFYRRHARQLAGYLMRVTRNAEAAADLTAETFAAALVSRSRYRPERASASSWLYGIAVHKLTDWQRNGYAEDRARRRLGMERPSLSDGDVLELERLAGEVTVVELLEELPREQREALRARLMDERSYGEIAGAEGVTEMAIRKRVSRGLGSLRGRMGGER